jgi:hypothetical protein
MAEFLIHRDPMQKTSTLVLKVENPTFGSERPFSDACLDCPVRNTKKAYGCSALGYSTYTEDVGAVMLTTDEGQCGIINDPNHSVESGNDRYDSLSATYRDKKTFVETRNKVREVFRNHGLMADPE